MLSIYLTTWRQVCQSHFEFSPSLTKSFNPSGNHRLGQYIFASEYFDLHILVLSEITLPFAESAIWRIRDSNSKPKGKRAFFKIVAKQLFRSLDFPPSPLQISLRCSLSWNRTNENPITHKLSRAINYPQPPSKDWISRICCKQPNNQMSKVMETQMGHKYFHPLK